MRGEPGHQFPDGITTLLHEQRQIVGLAALGQCAREVLVRAFNSTPRGEQRQGPPIGGEHEFKQLG